MPVVRQPRAVLSELVEPAEGTVEAVEIVKPRSACPADVGRLVTVVDVRLDDMPPAPVPFRRAAHGEFDAEIPALTVDILVTPVIRIVRSPVPGARHDAQRVPEFEGIGQPMRGFEAQGVVFRPFSGIVLVDVLRLLVFAVVAFEVSGAGLAFIIQTGEKRLRRDVQPRFGKMRDARIKIIQRPARVDPGGEVVFAVFVRGVVHRDALAAILVFKEIVPHDGIAHVCPMKDQLVAGRDIRLVEEAETVAVLHVIGNPVPVAPAGTRILVVGEIRLEMTASPLLEIPVEILPVTKPATVTVVNVRRSIQDIPALCTEDVPEVRGHQVTAPARRIPRHEAETVMRVEIAVRPRQVGERNAEEIRDGVEDFDIVVIPVASGPAHAPMPAAGFIGTRRHRQPVQVEPSVLPPPHLLGMDPEIFRDHVARAGQPLPRLVVVLDVLPCPGTEPGTADHDISRRLDVAFFTMEPHLVRRQLVVARLDLDVPLRIDPARLLVDAERVRADHNLFTGKVTLQRRQKFLQLRNRGQRDRQERQSKENSWETRHNSLL